MSTWFKFPATYWTDPRTMKLRRVIGDSANWVMPRLWSFAAQQDMSDDLSAYTEAEIAEQIGYKGDARALLAAIVEVGYLDRRYRLANWDWLFSLAASRRAAAKAGAKGRWKPANTDPRQEKTRQEGHAMRDAMRDASSSRMPTQAEWLAECKTMHPDWPARDAANAWNHYESTGWKRGKTLITKWRACIATCYGNYVRANPGRQYEPTSEGASTGIAEPRNWKARIRALRPDCIYAETGEAANATWSGLNEASQKVIIEVLDSEAAP